VPPPLVGHGVQHPQLWPPLAEHCQGVCKCSHPALGMCQGIRSCSCALGTPACIHPNVEQAPTDCGELP
jgi:hypothetical protein